MQTSETHIQIPSSADGSLQDALFWTPAADGPARPLLVGLHTWSACYTNVDPVWIERVRERGWVFIHPDFRGPARRPEAAASPQVIADILDAVAYARQHAPVDDRRIFLLGASGGGFHSLMMAAFHPEVWAGVSARVPIADLAASWEESRARQNNYDHDLEGVFGGPPDTPERRAAYAARSPLAHLERARGVRLDIGAGIHDGHTGSVPVGHALRAFNVLAAANGRPDAPVSEADVEEIVLSQAVPESVRYAGDEPYPRAIHLRREAGPARVTLFEGGHEGLNDAAFPWFDALAA